MLFHYPGVVTGVVIKTKISEELKMRNIVLTNSKLVLSTLLIILIFIGCSGVEFTTQKQEVELAGIEQLTDVVKAYYSSCEGLGNILAEESNIFDEATLRFKTILDAVIGFDQVRKEIRDLADREILELIELADDYNFDDKYKHVFIQVCKLTLIGFQTGTMFIKPKEASDSTNVSYFQTDVINYRLCDV